MQNLKNEKTVKQYSALSFFAVFGLIVIRFLYYGFNYFLSLDDYTQYLYYQLLDDKVQFVKNAGLLAARPLAGLFDVFVWGKMNSVLILAVIIISLLFAASAVLLRDVFSKYFKVGIGFLIVYTLLPVGTEGTYWLSASTRIVCGLFFASLSAFLLQKYIESRKPVYLVLSSVIQLIAYGYYEQIIVISITLNVLLLLANFKELKVRVLYAGISPANAVIYFISGSFFKSDLYSGRMNIVLPVNKEYFSDFLPGMLSQFKQAFVDGTIYITLRGAYRGAKEIINDRAIVFCAVLIALIIILAVCSKVFSERENNNSSKPKLNIPIKIIFAVLLAVAPITPFLVLGEGWFSLRGTVASFIGIALLADFLLQLISFKKHAIYATLCCLIAVVFCVSGVSEIHDYRKNYIQDTAVLTQIEQVVKEKDEGQRIGIINAEYTLVNKQNYYYHEHISSITSSDWCLSGAVHGYLKNENRATFIPLRHYGTYSKDTKSSINIDEIDAFYLYSKSEKKLYPVNCVVESDSTRSFYLENGNLCAVLKEDENGNANFEEF